MDTQYQPQHGSDDCCTPQAGLSGTHQGPNATKTWSAAAVAIGAAILSSACCWLPLALLGLGVSAAGLAKFVVGARWFFIAVAVITLGLGFYFSYRRKAACAPDEACAPSGLRGFNRAMLWLSAALVLVFATFPYYSAALLKVMDSSGNGTLVNSNSPTKIAVNTPSGSKRADHKAAAAMTQFRIYAYQIQGMDCRQCADGLQAAIAKMPGVKKAIVSYQHGTAEVQAGPGFDPHSVTKRISGIGYKTTLVNRNRSRANKNIQSKK
ncbi:MAG: mercuric transporter MerT family protein [Planctomycetia bacterium]|jgi:copper chaperone CopZ|nr:mercuric transporter MerT family protein [Planctomycetia bacterium]